GGGPLQRTAVRPGGGERRGEGRRRGGRRRGPGRGVRSGRAFAAPPGERSCRSPCRSALARREGRQGPGGRADGPARLGPPGCGGGCGDESGVEHGGSGAGFPGGAGPGLVVRAPLWQANAISSGPSKKVSSTPWSCLALTSTAGV